MGVIEGVWDVGGGSNILHCHLDPAGTDLPGAEVHGYMYKDKTCSKTPGDWRW